MFVVTVTFEAWPDSAPAFLARVRRQAEDSLSQEEGCLRFDVCTDMKRPERIFLYEIYRDEAAFRDHLNSAHFHAFDADAGPMLSTKAVETWSLGA